MKRRHAALALALLALTFGATLAGGPWADDRITDLPYYGERVLPALHGALPYRDFAFEYPPLAAPAMALPGVLAEDPHGYRLAFAGWTLLLAGAVVLLCGALAARSGGDPRRALLAAAAAPLLCGAMVRTHFDLAPVALTLAALLLLVRGRPRLGLAVLGAAVMTKGFPLVVAPVALAWLWGRGERRATVQAAAALLAVIALVGGAALAASPAGTLDSVRYQLERPVQVESAPATLLLAMDGLGAGRAVTLTSHGAQGLEHPAAGTLAALLTVVLLGVVATLAACAWRGVDRRPARIPAAADARLLVLASLTAVAAFAALGKVLSPQFLVWTIPLGVLALAWRVPLLAGAVAAATVLTQLEFPARYFDYVDRDPFPVALVSARNAVLLLAVWAAARTVLRQSSAASRICSIEVARPSSPAWIRTAFSQGSSSAVSKRTFV